MQIYRTKQEEEVEEEFEKFVNVEKKKAIVEYATEEELDADMLNEAIIMYEFSGRKPTRDDLIKTRIEQPSFRQRINIGERLIQRFNDFVGRFVE